MLFVFRAKWAWFQEKCAIKTTHRALELQLIICEPSLPAVCYHNTQHVRPIKVADVVSHPKKSPRWVCHRCVSARWSARRSRRTSPSCRRAHRLTWWPRRTRKWNSSLYPPSRKSTPLTGTSLANMDIRGGSTEGDVKGGLFHCCILFSLSSLVLIFNLFFIAFTCFVVFNA